MASGTEERIRRFTWSVFVCDGDGMSRFRSSEPEVKRIVR